MAQSAEYPDLLWGGPSRWFSEGRNRIIRYAVIHTTEGSEGLTSAEDGAAYNRVRDQSVSTHYFHDQNNTVQCILTSDRAYHARFHGNEIGIGYELCARAGQTPAQWHDAASLGTLRNAAKQVARDCVKYNLPVRRLSVAEVRAAYYAPADQRPRGICGHVDVTAAYPEDQGDHWDPGPNFPWDEFLDMVRAEMGEDMAFPEDHLYALIWRTEAILHNRPAVAGGPTKGERNDLHYALAAAAVAITPEQLAAVGSAAEAGAEKGVDDALEGATVTTTIDTPEPT